MEQMREDIRSIAARLDPDGGGGGAKHFSGPKTPGDLGGAEPNHGDGGGVGLIGGGCLCGPEKRGRGGRAPAAGAESQSEEEGRRGPCEKVRPIIFMM